MAADVFLLLI